MGLNKASGRMYPWVDYTWNPLGGKCPHDCLYCYMKRPPITWSKKYTGEQRIIEKEMNINLNNLELNRRENLPFVTKDAPVIFVCSGNDLGIAPINMKQRILKKCKENEKNFYVLQTKNPIMFKVVENEFPSNVILGTTIETNNVSLCKMISNAPPAHKRIMSMTYFNKRYHKMISIEPIMDFDLEVIIAWMRTTAPDFVSIGADSGNNHLVEPDANKILDLINGLKEFTIVLQKENLNRLIENE